MNNMFQHSKHSLLNSSSFGSFRMWQINRLSNFSASRQLFPYMPCAYLKRLTNLLSVQFTRLTSTATHSGKYQKRNAFVHFSIAINDDGADKLYSPSHFPTFLDPTLLQNLQYSITVVMRYCNVFFTAIDV